MNEILLRLEGRPFGLNAKALKVWGNKNPELAQAFNQLEKYVDTLNRRRAIVQQMQLDNIMKPFKQPKGI